MYDIDHENVIPVETNGRSLLVHFNEKSRKNTKIYSSLEKLQKTGDQTFNFVIEEY